MDGVFDFDERGVATVILAPDWSRAALNRVQQMAQGAVNRIDHGFSKEDLKAYIKDEFERLNQSNRALKSEVSQLSAQVAAMVDRKPMDKVKKFFIGLGFAIGFIVDSAGVVQMGADAVDTVTRIIETATFPDIIDLAPGPDGGRDSPGGASPL